MSGESRKHSEPYTGYSETRLQARALASLALDGFRLHPYFFFLENSANASETAYPFAHQLELIAKLFARRPIRALVADEIGLGKTVSAIMVILYLLKHGDAERVLILVPRVILKQWLDELKRFGIHRVEVLERENLSSRYRGGFFEPGVYVASIDLVKRDEYRGIVDRAEWDLIVVDEAHRVGRTGGNETLRYKLVKSLVGDPGRSVLFLTATPHRGKPEDYIERVKLIDPHLDKSTRELNDKEFYKIILGSLVFRRTKIDVNEVYEKTPIFTKCKFKARLVGATDEERRFHERLREFLASKLQRYHELEGEKPRAVPLLLTLIAKRASSSPMAAVKTLYKILSDRAESIRMRRGSFSRSVSPRDLDEEASLIAEALLSSSFEDSGVYVDEVGRDVDFDEVVDMFAGRCSSLLEDRDIEELKEILELARMISEDKDSRLNSLIAVLEKHLKNGEKIVVFTEFRDTAEYVFNALKRRLPQEYSERIALVTSEKITPPAVVEPEGARSVEDVKRWLKTGNARVIVSTDVASEGLNLQAASVVVHYEPTWSPVKIVQRIGRVWRLGQERDVTSYSLLLDVEIDVAVLEVLYAKLLSWIVSGIEKNVLIGDELEIDFTPKKERVVDLAQIAPTAGRGRKGYSEYEAITVLLRGGKEALRAYIEGIIGALKSMAKQAEQLGLNRVDEKKVEPFLKEGLGGLYGKSARDTLIELLRAIAKLSGVDVEEKSSGLSLRGTRLANLRSEAEFYTAIRELLRDSRRSPPIVLLAERLKQSAWSSIREVYLYEVTVFLKEGSGYREPVFSETVGIAVKEDSREAEVIRGRELLSLLAALLDNVRDSVEDFQIGGGVDDLARKAEDEVLQTFRDRIIQEYRNYLNESREEFRISHQGWIPEDLKDIASSSRLLGVVVLTGGPGALPPAPSEEVEKQAMRYAMEYEMTRGRVPEDVSKTEHYDIRSTDPRTGEVRYIEVKGRWGLTLTVELTESEYEFGKKAGDKYWLYIVYGFSTGKPRMIALRDPANRALWQETTEVKKRYRLILE